MDPLLIEVPERIETERLVLRMPRRGDGPMVNEAIRVSLAELGPWLPWAGAMPTVEESEAHCRRQQARFMLREDFVLLIFARAGDGGEGELLGGTGLHRIDWPLRRFEIGYWRKTGCAGRGIVTEAVKGLARMAFDVLGARRVEIRMDDNNVRSWKLAERAGFTHEALLRFDAVNPAGEPRSTRVYARVRGAEEPMDLRAPARSAGRDGGTV
jgi:RimJ/RimL family protein N-acetyltransferase